MQVMCYCQGMAQELDTRKTGALATEGGSLLRNLTAAWLAEYTSPNTRAAYARDVAAWTEWAETNSLDPLAAQRPHVAAWSRVMEAEGLRPTTIARRLASLSSLYSYAVAVEVLASNPVKDVRRPATGEAHVQITEALSREEVSSLIAAAEAPRDRALVLLLAVQALRVSEALSLDLDGTEVVRGHVTYVVRGKGGTESRIPLPPIVVDALTALGEAEGRTTGPVFVSETGERLTRHGVTRALARLSRRAHLSRKVTPHMLRATAVTLALDAGASLRDVQDLARHSDPKTTRRYDRNRGALDRHASYVLAGVLAEDAA
jgi:integrase/recombinase XerD